MLFSSAIFFLFFIVFYTIHLASPKSIRLFIIIIASTVFYGYWNLSYVWIPHFLALVTFFGALWLDNAEISWQRKSRFILVLLMLLSPMIFFKYTNFICQQILAFDKKPLDLLLPLGISFVTFSLIAYIAEVYKKNHAAEKNLGNLMAYTLFFPHLIAGPILKPAELIPQFENLTKSFRPKRFVYGMTLFSFGLLKKLVFADPLASVVQSVYSSPAHLSSVQYLLAMYGFSVQIYCDFSGYTDMAMGIAYILGISLPNNFSHPYTSQSIIEFWRRWHITLSTWLKDYIYIPLGGSQRGLRKQSLNLLITMAIGGLWHGANWTFLLWGFFHGFFIAINHYLIKIARFSFFKQLPKIPRWIKIIFVFHLVTILWVFFRAPNFQSAWMILTGPFTATTIAPSGYVMDNLFPLILMVIFFFLHRLDDHRRIYWFSRKKFLTVVLPSIFFIWLIAVTISVGSSAKFIYFDF